METKKNINLLLVEDDPEDIEIIQDMIKGNRNIYFNVVTVDYLSKGLDYISKDKFDIIISDLGLPDSQGMETLIRILNKTEDTPIIVMTGLNDESIGIDAVQKGAQDYIIKGQVDSNSLVRAVQYAIERKSMEIELKKYTEHLEEEVRKRTNELIQSEKMASLGQLVAGVAHEINNPLGFLNSNTDIIEELIQSLDISLNDEKIKNTLENITKLINTNRNGIKRIAKITKSLKRFAAPNTYNKAPADINQGIKDTILILYNQFKQRIKLHEDYGEIPKIICNIGHLNQVFMNLLINSSQAMDMGDIWVKTWVEKYHVWIEISDNGGGIELEILNKIFDPFFTTKDGGTGLGLSLAYRIICDHDGIIIVDSKIGEGTKMMIKIPAEV